MKRSKIVFICLVMSALLLTGCIFHPPRVSEMVPSPEDVTVEQLFEAAKAKAKSARTQSHRETMEMELELSMMGQNVSISMNADISMESQDTCHHIRMDVTAGAKGQNTTQSLEYYMVPGEIDEKVVVYQKAGGRWTKQSTDRSPVNIKDAELILTPELAAKMTLQPGSEQYEGIDSYVVTGKVAWEDISAYVDLDKLTDSIGQGAAADLDLSDLRFEVFYHFAKDDLRLLGTSLGGADSIAEFMRRAFKSMLGMDVGIEIPAFTVKSHIEYDIIDEVTVPEEVLHEAGGA